MQTSSTKQRSSFPKHKKTTSPKEKWLLLSLQHTARQHNTRSAESPLSSAGITQFRFKGSRSLCLSLTAPLVIFHMLLFVSYHSMITIACKYNFFRTLAHRSLAARTISLFAARLPSLAPTNSSFATATPRFVLHRFLIHRPPFPARNISLHNSGRSTNLPYQPNNRRASPAAGGLRLLPLRVPGQPLLFRLLRRRDPTFHFAQLGMDVQ